MINLTEIAATLEKLAVAQQAGRQIEDPKTWSDRAGLAANISVTLTGMAALLALTGHTSIDGDTINNIATVASIALPFMASGFTWVSHKFHTASNEGAGK